MSEVDILTRKKRLAEILETGKIRLWFYRPANRHYFFLPVEGDVEKEYNPVEFSQLYQYDRFEKMRSVIFNICDGKQDSAKLILRSNDPTEETCHYYEESLSVVKRDEDGRPALIMGIQHDITEETRRQQRADALLMRYHTIFNSSLLDMLYYDKNGVLTDINERACAAFNVKDYHDVLDGSFLLQNNPMFNQIPLEQLENTLTSSIVDFADLKDEKYRIDEFQLHGKMYYESAINPIRNERGELEGIYMAGRDISEMVESFHRQQDGLRRLQRGTESIKEYIANINYALRVNDVSLVNYYPHSYTFELSNSVTGTKMRMSQLRCIRLATPRFRRAVSSVLNRMDHLTQHSINQTIEIEIRDKKGRQMWFLFNMVPMLDDQGKVERYFGMCRNVTDLVEMEHRLAVESQKAKETDLLKQAFLTNMSYEIRTPLNTVVGFAGLFATDHDEADEAFFVEQIKNSTNSLLVLVNDILFLSRLDAHMEEYTTNEVDFAQVFDSQCHLGLANLRPEVQAVVSQPYNSLVLDIDVEHVGMVVQRLCMLSSMMTTQGTITCNYEYRRGELTISIEDTGKGIHPDNLAHAFERFNRNEEGQMCGTGLDLPIVQSMVQQMGGTIDMQSELGKGTTVWVSIPCTAKEMEKKREVNINPSEL